MKTFFLAVAAFAGLSVAAALPAGAGAGDAAGTCPSMGPVGHVSKRRRFFEAVGVD
ncbi:hypothetical protein UVI_02008110 [Ustilaginoidea virens]|uniref:Uncharacterized protein n=1 Tax=Ustilaginoidea virens TaxID=1159556 RepID=A0A1B5L7I4_USTVR|nr:hypothetical protein UVI_02008110 [Ustilaginoidea virens]